MLGTLDPAESKVLGATFRVIRAEHNRETGEVLFAITSCPSSLEMASFEMDGTPMDQFNGRGSCSGNVATWTQAGVTDDVTPDSGSVGVDMVAESLFVNTATTVAGWHGPSRWCTPTAPPSLARAPP